MMHRDINYLPPAQPNALRIIGAIAAKDLSQIVSNRALLTMILSTLFILLTYRFLPLLGDEATTSVLLYDPSGESALTTALDGSDEVSASVYQTADQVTGLLQHGEVAELGLVLPDDIEAQLDAGGPLALTGQFAYWVSDQQAADIVSRVAGVLSAELDRPVTIAIDENRVYAAYEATGLSFLMAISLVIAILMAGIGMVPTLMLDEKQSRTIDMLMISPASPTHITLGKAVAGLSLAGAAAAIALLLYYPAVVQWSLAVVAVLGWSLWAIAAGLLVGSLVRESSQHQIVMWLLSIPLILSAFLLVMTDLLPPWLPPYLRLLPSAASMDLLRMTGMAALPMEQVIWRLVLVYGSALVMLVAVAWILRRRQV